MKKIAAVIFAGASLAVGVPFASADAPGPGDQPQCAGGQFPGSNGNPHCPQNK